MASSREFQNPINWSVMSDTSDDDELEPTGDNSLSSANRVYAGQPDTVENDVSESPLSDPVSANSVSDLSSWKTSTDDSDYRLTDTLSGVSEVEGNGATSSSDYFTPRRILPTGQMYAPYRRHQRFRPRQARRRFDPTDYRRRNFRCAVEQRRRYPLRRKLELSRYCTRVKTSSAHHTASNLRQETQEKKPSDIPGQNFETPKRWTKSDSLNVLIRTADHNAEDINTDDGKQYATINIMSDDEETYDNFWQALREFNAKEKEGSTSKQTGEKAQPAQNQAESSSVHDSSFQSCKDSHYRHQSFSSCSSEMEDEELSGTEPPPTELHFDGVF